MARVEQDQRHEVRSRGYQHQDRPWQRYRTAGVVLVGAGLALALALALLGRAYLAVLCLAALLGAVSCVRLQRPVGSWMAARSRLFDAVFGLGLVIVLVALSGLAAGRHG